MSDETKKKMAEWLAELIKSVGFPIVVCGALLWWGFAQIENIADEARGDRRFIREKLTQMVSDNTEVMREVAKIAAENQAIMRNMDSRLGR